ncbi:MAG: cyanoexosortase B system-associated protein [Scytonema sp. PMC 1069.18]|nr:cyanoexosortase B system-associated protein [Scytonema sp. PMC 1069.18]MEC4885684.1 cyanoexosortase B system-associated protein [Scytonema sp. PMC 1070.18]
MISFSKFLNKGQFPQVVAIVLLLLLLALGAVPGYLTGRWEWWEPPRIVTLKELKQVREKGLALPGWKTIEQREQQVGGHKWSYQLVQKQGSQIKTILLLLPQNGPRDQPEVEWTEIDSLWQWQIAQFRSAEFTVEEPQESGSKTEAKVEARFFRAVAKDQTFAVLQWYASSLGGSSSPLNWFFADQLAQWHKKRVPWVAVCIVYPMEPLGQVETTWNEMKSIGQTVQGALMSGPL